MKTLILEKDFLFNEKIIKKDTEVCISDTYFKDSEIFNGTHKINNIILENGYFKIVKKK